MGKVIAFINFKGGVGKTSNAVNLGAVLAQNYGKKVLIVDLDAQCNATYWLLKKADRIKLEQDPRKTTCQIFRDYINSTHTFDFDAAVHKMVPRSEEGNPHIADLDLLGAHVELIDVEDQLGRRLLHPYFTFLKQALKPHIKGYDFVFLDCPPNIYNVSKNALFFADHTFIPYIADYLSLSGFRVFAHVLQRFQNQAKDQNPGLNKPLIGGVIVNRFKNVGNVYPNAIGQLKIELWDLKRIGLVHEKARILAPPIRDCVKMAECSNFHLPVSIHAPTAISSEDYNTLAFDFLQQISALDS